MCVDDVKLASFRKIVCHFGKLEVEVDEGLCDLELVKMHHMVNLSLFVTQSSWISVPESSYFLLGLELGHNGVYLLLQLAEWLYDADEANDIHISG